MEDRFKFRGKRIDNGRFFYGSYLYLKNPPSYRWDGKRQKGNGDVHFIIDEEDLPMAIDHKTLGQCTGLKDKNGKLIYEGDILADVKHQYIVEWSAKEGYFIRKPWVCHLFHYRIDKGTTQNTKIIGNIYENPELLEERE